MKQDCDWIIEKGNQHPSIAFFIIEVIY